MTEPVGTPAEEAARLLDAASTWVAARVGDLSAVAASASAAAGSAGSTTTSTPTEPAAGPQQVAPGHAPECAACPVCRAVRLVRGVRPETVEHLLAAAGSLGEAVRSLSEPPPAPSSPGTSSPVAGPAPPSGEPPVVPVDVT